MDGWIKGQTGGQVTVLTYGGVSTLSVLTTTGGGLACKTKDRVRCRLTDLAEKAHIRIVGLATYSSHVLVQHVEHICYRLPRRSGSKRPMTCCTVPRKDRKSLQLC